VAEFTKDTLIVVVTYNSADYIVNCLDSIVKSDYSKWFLAVIDNKSSDDTLQKISGFNACFDGSNFKLLSLNKNIGFAPAVNYCVFNYLFKQDRKLAENIKFLVLINPDVVIEAGTLTRLLDTLKYEQGRQAYGAAGGIIFDYEKKNIQNAGGKIENNFITRHLVSPPEANRQKSSGLFEKGPAGKNFCYEVDYVTGALFALRMELFASLKGLDGGYRPLYFEELDLCFKLRRAGFASVINPAVSAAHFEGASVKKFSGSFYSHYHKNRLRCAVINCGFADFFTKFIPAEIKWLKNSATSDQRAPILKAYFLNFVFFLYNLTFRLKNTLIIAKLRKSAGIFTR
jgi:O-antigen biosynthesis protein